MGDDPPFLSVGTEVSAKYKGAFCEAKVRKVVKSIKCKVMFKLGLGSAVVSDEQIKGLLRVGAQVEAKHPEKAQFLEGIISKIQDCSQYTVVFDDGDITTLRRTALCLKSGRHFAESETLDQLPLTHPEHFGTPVLGGRRGRRRDDSSDDEGDASSEPGRKEQSGGCKRTEDREPDIGKIVCVEISDKKKGKEPWFPGLIVAPTAQDAVSIRVKDEYLVRSFKDARYYTVPKKEALEFTREIALKTEINTLKAAIEKAVLYLDRDELPAHWDREVLFGLDDSSSLNESKAGSDPDSSDDETREEKDHFVAQLYKFMDDSGTPINKAPTINNRDLDLYRLFKIVHKLGGFNRVTNQNAWKAVTQKMILATASNSSNLLKQAYKKYLHGFEEFYRKLGCTMNSPRGPKSRSRPGRSLIRDRDRASGSLTPKCDIDDDEKPKAEVKVEKVDKVEEVSAAVSPPTSAATAAAAAVGAVVEEAVAKAEAKEKEETLPPQKKKERPSRLSEKKAPVKEESDENDQENESGSSHSVRSQRGTRSRKPEGELTPEPNRNRRKTKSKAEDKTNEEEEKPVPHVKVEEEAAVTNGKEAAVEKKSKTPLRENKMKAAKKNESEVKTPHGDDSKKAESLPAAEEVRPPPKRRGRKPKALLESEEAMTRRDSQVINEINDFREETGHLAPNVDVQIGDRLKIYFDKQDSNVTYEAKVCEIRNEGTSKVYLVHYTGWNTRYDEWVKRTRIAENLTWTPNRKRNKSAQGGPAAQSSSTSGSSSVKIGPAKRGRTKGRDSSRSATPSSVTSTSSTGQRNASQLSGEETSGKQPPCKANRRRSRRISEMSAVSTESLGFSDDDEEEDNDDQGIRRRKKPAKKSTAESEESEAIEVDDSEMTPRRRRRRRQISETEEMLTEMKNLPAELPAEEVVSATPTAAAAAVATSTSTPTSSTTAPAPGPTTSVPTVTTPVRRGRRRALPLPEATGESPAKIVASSAPEKEEEALAVKIPESSTNDLNQHPGEDSKGTDFDLKKIRSELKIPADIAAATAAPPAAPPSAVAATATVSGAAATTAGGGMTTSVASMSPSSAPQQPGCLSPGMKGSDDDVYEFREPEPFEFEVRARRESPFSEEKVHRFVHKNKEKEEENSPKKPSPSSPQHANPAEKIKAAITVTTPPRTRPSLSVTSVPTATTLDNHPHHPESAQPESPPPPPPPPTIEPPSTTSAQNSPRPVVSAEDVSVEDVQDSAKTAGLFTPISPASATAPSVLPQVTNSDLSSPPTQISDSPVVTAPAAVTTTTTSTTTTPAAVIATITTTTTTTTTVVSVVAATAVATTPEAVVSLGSAPQLELKEEPASVIVSTIAEDCKSKSPLKRERRKTNKKAISREFIESDEDSPEDVRTSDVKLEVDSEEKPSGDSDHCETAEEEKSEEVNPASVIVDNVPKPGSSSYSLPKAKLDEDLDENLLLCEETIPGSPVTYSSSSASVADCPDGAVSHPVASTSRSTVEMPFASAPASSNSPRTRGLTGGANPGARTSRKRGLRQALAMQRPIRCASGGSAVMENTPPTTPDGSLSSSSNSPQGDNGSFSPEHEGSIKSERDFSENDNQMAASLQVPTGPPSRNVGPRASATLPTPNLPNPLPPPATVKRREEETVAKEEESPVKKRKRGTGSDQCSRRGRGHGRSPRRTGSDSEETTSEFMNSSGVSGCVTLTSYQPRSTRYNFCTDLDPDMDASQRIVFLQEKLRDLRQTYSALKAQLVLIDRRRKKLKRKEKDPSF